MRSAPDEIIKPCCQLDENGNIMKDNYDHPIFLGNSLTTGFIREMPQILYKAKKCYEKMVKNSSFILSKEYLDRIQCETSDVTSELYVETIETCFEKSPTDKIPKTLFLKIISKYLAQNGKKIQPFEKEKYERTFMNIFKLELKTEHHKSFYYGVTVTPEWCMEAKDMDKTFVRSYAGDNSDGFFIDDNDKNETPEMKNLKSLFPKQKPKSNIAII
jgi:hypothetical protein